MKYHLRHINGYSDSLENLAREIINFQKQDIVLFVKDLSLEFERQSINDNKRGYCKLSKLLTKASSSLFDSYEYIEVLSNAFSVDSLDDKINFVENKKIKDLAYSIGSMSYDQVSVFLNAFQKEVKLLSSIYYVLGYKSYSNSLLGCQSHIGNSKEYIDKSWDLSSSHMEHYFLSE